MQSTDPWTFPPDELLERAEACASVRQAVADLAKSHPRLGAVVAEYFGLDGRDGLSLWRVGKAFSVSGPRARMLRDRALRILRAALREPVAPACSFVWTQSRANQARDWRDKPRRDAEREAYYADRAAIEREIQARQRDMELRLRTAAKAAWRKIERGPWPSRWIGPGDFSRIR